MPDTHRESVWAWIDNHTLVPAMTDLTEKILSLDKECEATLEKANLTIVETKKEADQSSEKSAQEKLLQFEAQKRAEAQLLTQKMDDAQRDAMDALDQKMAKFEEKVSTDTIAEHLLSVAKGQVCH